MLQVSSLKESLSWNLSRTHFKMVILFCCLTCARVHIPLSLTIACLLPKYIKPLSFQFLNSYCYFYFYIYFLFLCNTSILKICIFFNLCIVCTYMHLYVPCICLCPQRPEEGTDVLELGIEALICYPVGATNQTRLFSIIRNYSYLLIHCFSPYIPLLITIPGFT